MEGRWIGGPPGGPNSRVSLQSKQQIPKEREGSRDGKSSAVSAAPSTSFTSKGGPQGGGSLGGPRGAQAANSKKTATAAAPASEPTAANRTRISSSSATISTSSSSSTATRAPSVQQLPLQTEEEFLRGCGFQAIWGESFEVSGLMNAAVKMCKLAPTEGDEEWQEAHLSFLHLLGLCNARLGRHHCLLKSRLQDVEDVLQLEEEIQDRIKQYKEGIAIAKGELEVAELMRKRRKELDAICGEVLKKPCLRETTSLEHEEVARRNKAENTTKDLTARIATKKRQAEAAITAAEDLFENPTVEVTAMEELPCH